MALRAIGQYRKVSDYEKDKKDWVCYIEKFMLFFEANEVEEDSKKKTILLSNVGAEI